MTVEEDMALVPDIGTADKPNQMEVILLMSSFAPSLILSLFYQRNLFKTQYIKAEDAPPLILHLGSGGSDHFVLPRRMNTTYNPGFVSINLAKYSYL